MANANPSDQRSVAEVFDQFREVIELPDITTLGPAVPQFLRDDLAELGELIAQTEARTTSDAKNLLPLFQRLQRSGFVLAFAIEFLAHAAEPTFTRARQEFASPDDEIAARALAARSS